MADQENEERRREFWQTLLAMGFEPDKACTGTYSAIKLDSQVFQRGIYHTKAAELVFHFLLTQLDPTRFKREFFDAWPIADPRQARDFRAHVFKWLDELRRDSNEAQEGDARWPTDVPVRRSYIDECKGPRFEQILWALALFVAHSLLRHGSGAWSAYLKHPMIVVSAGSGMDREETDSVARALDGCRARYARRIRDRMRAQETWQATERELRERIDNIRTKRSRTHEEYRALRMKVSQIESTAIIPEADSSAEAVERALGILVDSTKRLWSESAGWVEGNKSTVGLVDAVMEKRANSVRLDGHKHVRLAPPPQLATEWTSWLAEHNITPFRGSSTIDLQAVARMASVSAGALWRSLASDGGHLSLLDGGSRMADTDAPPGMWVGAGERIEQLDNALIEQESRIERLKRIKAQLGEQQCKAERIVRERRSDCIDGGRSETGAAADLVAETPTAPHNGPLRDAGSSGSGTLVQVGHLAAAIGRFAIGSSPPLQHKQHPYQHQNATPSGVRTNGSGSMMMTSPHTRNGNVTPTMRRRRREAVMQQLSDLWDNNADKGREEEPLADTTNEYLDKILAPSAWPSELPSSSARKATTASRLSLMSFMTDNNATMLSGSSSRKRTYGSIMRTAYPGSNRNDEAGDLGYRRIKRQASSQADDEFDQSMLVDEGVPDFLVQ
ncbi:hypothetical protein IWW48_002951 [Coemansia sp. RSA 1200]|nr:hypothetical protein IWW48_002951 [Coemansia sp. RSA 1200]